MIKTVLLATLIPLGIILLIIFLVYLFGNVYNGLVRRRESVRSSYRELKKGFLKVFELIPSLTRGIVNDDKMKETFASLYSRYNSFDRENVHELASLSVAFEDAIRELKTTSSDKEIIPFVEDSIRLAHFSIKFYKSITYTKDNELVLDVRKDEPEVIEVEEETTDYKFIIIGILVIVVIIGYVIRKKNSK